MTTTQDKIQRDWFSKTLAGTILGLTLALYASGLFLQLASGILPSVKVQLAMWLVAPIWLGVLSATYLFRNGTLAWSWLVVANLLVFNLYTLAKLL